MKKPKVRDKDVEHNVAIEFESRSTPYPCRRIRRSSSHGFSPISSTSFGLGSTLLIGSNATIDQTRQGMTFSKAEKRLTTTT
jgi:hypothetical protein